MGCFLNQHNENKISTTRQNILQKNKNKKKNIHIKYVKASRLLFAVMFNLTQKENNCL